MIETINQALINNVIREVLVRVANLQSDSEPVTEAVPELADQVITEETLSSAGLTGSRVRIKSNAIVTPTAKDFIRQHGLTLLRGDERSPYTPAAAGQILILPVNLNETVRGLTNEFLSQTMFDVDYADDSSTAIQRGVGELSRAGVRGVVVISDHPAKVACIANRSPRVRAAAVNSIASLTAIAECVRPNFVAIAAGGQSRFGLLRIVKEFAGMDHTAPADWKE